MSAVPTFTTLADILASRVKQAHRVRFQVSPDWQQGRTTFGGLLSVMAVQAMRDTFGSEWPLRALQTNFVGPIAPGECIAEITLLRQGKNIRQVQCRILQIDAEGQENVGGVLLGVFGVGRDSGLPALQPAQPDTAKTPDEAFLLPFIPGLTPEFTRYLEFRVSEGGIPFTNSADWHSRTHIRLKQADSIDHELMTILLSDAGPTPALARLNRPAPASSVSWALELRPVASTFPVEGHWRMDKDALVVSEGYVNERTHLWTPDGQLAALGYQVVAVYG